MTGLATTLASCLMMAAQTYAVPPAALVGIMRVEGGRVGQAVGPNSNGTYDLGPMQINTIWVPQLADHWGVSQNTAYRILRDDGCANINVAAWILRQRLDGTDNDLSLAIAHYHSYTPRFGYPYAQKVIQTIHGLDLVQ
jgi:soluble lytic murein transglycosylase-like protein